MIRNEKSPEGGFCVEKGTFDRREIEFVARRVIVKLEPADSEKALVDSLQSVLAKVDGARVLKEPGKSGRMVLLIAEGESVTDCATRLSGNDAVAYAEPDVVDRAMVVPNDANYANQYAPGLVNAEAAWDLETGDSNVIMGIIDSGISMTGGALDHDDLSTPGRFTLGTDFVDGGTPRDTNGHGTHVAGIAGAAGNNATGVAGMNWGSPFYICRTLDNLGNGSSSGFADAVEEITDFALANGLKAVINYSAGGGENNTKRLACEYASDNGMLVVAATGNDNGGPVIWPAAYSTTITGVVAVGSTDSNDNVSGFSNVGPEVTVVAPGSNIYSTMPTYAVTLSGPPANAGINYGTLDGTSMATPLVTGLAALMWSRHPGHTNQKIKQCLKDTAVELGSANFDNSWGYGRVDALEAVKCGDLVVVPTRLSRYCIPSHLTISCGPKSLLVIQCFPKTAICPTSQLQKCPSKLPVLCPTTRVSGCWSHLMCFEPKTQLSAGCGTIKTAICPSAVDACPSAPGGCFDPGIPINPIRLRISALERELAELKQEVWYQGDGSSDEEGDGDWFYVDDDGEIHDV
jgi:hypothetical protein